MWPSLAKASAALAYRGPQDEYTFQLLDGGAVRVPRPYQATEFEKVLQGARSKDIRRVDDVYYWLSRQDGLPSAVWLPKRQTTALVLLDGFRDGPHILRNARMRVKSAGMADLGLSYTYPPGWSRSVAWSDERPAHSDDLFAFGMNTASSAARSSDCIVCGSRGGQATLIGIWRSRCHKPAVVINAGCSRPGLAWENNQAPVVLIAGGRDFFKGNRSDDQYFDDLWDAVPLANRDATALVYLDGMQHKMTPGVAASVLPACIAFCLSGSMLEDSTAASFRRAMSRAGGPGRLKTSRRDARF